MPLAGSPSERRAFGRRENLVHAFARISGRGPEPCVVRNFSDNGALLAFDRGFEPPVRFRLIVEAKGLDVLCDVSRRDGLEVGVQFVDDAGTGEGVQKKSVTKPEAQPEVEVVVPRLSEEVNIVTVVSGAEMRRVLGL